MTASLARSGPVPAALAEHEQWHAVGATVVELAYAGRGHYSAHETTVVRLTARQVITATGCRFWRHGTANPLKLVGQTSKQHAGIPVDVVRLVTPDNRHAVAALSPAKESQ